MLDVLEQDLSVVPTKHPKFDDLVFPAGAFDGPRFYQHLNDYEEGCYLWVVSYTINDTTFTRTHLPIERLVYQIASCAVIPDNCKHILAIHTKLVLVRRSNKTIAAYAGSLNFVKATNPNLMFQLQRQHHTFATQYFQTLWKHKS